MRVPLSWLREYVPVEVPLDELAARVNTSVAEVERVVRRGDAEPRQIVCGAWNFGPGATVAVALPGAVLPDGQRLEAAKLRGTVSEGMILSERELELGSDHAGILVLDDGPAPGTPLADVLPIADDVLELETTPNRPDLLSVYGVAREVAALYDLPLGPWPGSVR